MPPRGTPVVNLIDYYKPTATALKRQQRSDAFFISNVQDQRRKKGKIRPVIRTLAQITKYHNSLPTGPFEGKNDERSLAFWVSQVNYNMWKNKSTTPLLDLLIESTSDDEIRNAVENVRQTYHCQEDPEFIAELLEEALGWRQDTYEDLFQQLLRKTGPHDFLEQLYNIEEAADTLKSRFNTIIPPSALANLALFDCFVEEEWFHDFWKTELAGPLYDDETGEVMETHDYDDIDSARLAIQAAVYLRTEEREDCPNEDTRIWAGFDDVPLNSSDWQYVEPMEIDEEGEENEEEEDTDSESTDNEDDGEESSEEEAGDSSSEEVTIDSNDELEID